MSREYFFIFFPMDFLSVYDFYEDLFRALQVVKVTHDSGGKSFEVFHNKNGKFIIR